MKHSDKLRTKLADLIAKMRAVYTKAETENRDVTEAETAEYETLSTNYEATEGELKRVETLEAREAAQTAREKTVKTDVTRNLDRVTEPKSSIIRVNDDLTATQIVGICAWGAAKAKHYPTKTALQHIEEAGFQKISDMSQETKNALVEIKSFQTLAGQGGDNAVVTPLSGEFIETLRNESIFLAGAPLPVDLSYGSLDISGGLVGATGTYTAEGSDLGYTQMTTRKINLSAKHLGAVTAISNYAIDVSPLAIASIVGDDLAMGLTLAIDAAGLRGDGSGANPSGILSLVNAAHKFAVATATGVAPTYAQIDSDMKAVLTKIRSSNIPKRRRRWLMCNRTFTYLQFMRDGNGNFVYPGLQLDNPTWYDNYPVLLSEQIPSNLGAGTNESEIYLVDFGHVLLGTARAMTLKSSTEASYKNSGGTLVSAFSRDETVIRGVGSHDFEMRHDKAAVVLTTVKWGG